MEGIFFSSIILALIIIFFLFFKNKNFKKKFDLLCARVDFLSNNSVLVKKEQYRLFLGGNYETIKFLYAYFKDIDIDNPNNKLSKITNKNGLIEFEFKFLSSLKKPGLQEYIEKAITVIGLSPAITVPRFPEGIDNPDWIFYFVYNSEELEFFKKNFIDSINATKKILSISIFDNRSTNDTQMETLKQELNQKMLTKCNIYKTKENFEIFLKILQIFNL